MSSRGEDSRKTTTVHANNLEISLALKNEFVLENKVSVELFVEVVKGTVHVKTVNPPCFFGVVVY